jgi:hypothetical protein
MPVKSAAVKAERTPAKARGLKLPVRRDERSSLASLKRFAYDFRKIPLRIRLA